MDQNEMKVRLTFVKPILGTKPNDPEIHSRFVASKAPDHETMEQEVAALGAEEVEERGKTVFFKMEDGTPYLKSYQIKGFFKEAARTLKKVPGTKTKNLTAFLKRIDNFIFVYGDLPDDDEVIPLYMPLDMDLTATDCQRPLRASTPQGERVALAHSEEAPAGTWMEFRVMCLDPADLKYVREWLDYGRLKGIGQWRNSGKGRFTWEEL